MTDNPDERPENRSPVICKHMTPTGRQCRQHAMAGTDHCVAHRLPSARRPMRASLMEINEKLQKEIIRLRVVIRDLNATIDNLRSQLALANVDRRGGVNEK